MAQRTPIRLRFRADGDDEPTPPFAECDPERLIARAVAFARRRADERHRLELGPEPMVLVEALGPKQHTWTQVGSFHGADLLGGFAPERWSRLLRTARRMVLCGMSLARERRKRRLWAGDRGEP
jgi:hypothetical protein